MMRTTQQVGRNEVLISTVNTYDAGWETCLFWNNDRHSSVVESYRTAAEARGGHTRWASPAMRRTIAKVILETA